MEYWNDGKMEWGKIDEFVKTLKRQLFVIPAKAGIQLLQNLIDTLDSGFHRSDDFLRDH